MIQSKQEKFVNIQHLAGTTKRKNVKPPIGYVCNICKADGESRHYVTMCPQKVKKSVPANATTTKSTTTTSQQISTTQSIKSTKTISKTIPASSSSSSPTPNIAINDPAANPCKVFVSGLLFTTTKKELSDLFGSADDQVVVANIRLLLFTGSKRCNGQAFVTMSTSEGASKAIELLHDYEQKDEQGTIRKLKVIPALTR